MPRNQTWIFIVAVTSLFVAVITLFFIACNEQEEQIQPLPPPPILSMTLTKMSPAMGPSVGGTSVVLTGEGFTPNVQVLFGEALANQVEWISEEEIVVLAPPLPGKQGPVSVKVIDPENKTSSSEQKFSYFTVELRLKPSQMLLTEQKPQSVIPLHIRDNIEKLAIITSKDQKFGFFSWNSKDSTLKLIDLPSSKTQATLLAQGDLNGDKQEDLVLADPTGFVNVLFQDGKGGFLPPYTFSAPKDIKWMNVMDVNQDGALDIVTISGSYVTTLVNNQRGGFSLTQPTYIGQNPQSFDLGDINYDQQIDLLIVANQKLYISLGNENGTFGIPLLRRIENVPQAVALADINRDGTLDWLVSTTDSSGKNNKLLLFVSQEDKTQKLTVFDVGAPITSMVTGDMNGDGFVDVVTLGSKFVAVFMGTEQGTLEPARNFPIGMDSQKLMIADMNGDLKPDLVILSTDPVSPGIMILFNESQ